MEYIWRVLCCAHIAGSGPNEYDDNTLLDTRSSSSNNNRNDNNVYELGGFMTGTNPHHSPPMNLEENEGITSQIIEAIGEVGEVNVETLQNTFSACVAMIPSVHVRLYVINQLLDIVAKKNNKVATLKALVSVLDEKQQQEFASIVTGLPSSVLGDAFAKEQTRVLVDIIADTKECTQIDRIRISGQRKFIETIVEMFQQTLSPLDPSGQLQVVVGVLGLQSPAMKMKITLKQLIFSRTLQSDHSARENFMQQLLRVDSPTVNTL